MFCCKLPVGVRQRSGCGLPSPTRSGSKEVNQGQLNKHTLSKRKFPVQSASFHFTVSVHLPDHPRQQVWGIPKECHCTCCSHLRGYRTKRYLFIYFNAYAAASTWLLVFQWCAHLTCKLQRRRGLLPSVSRSSEGWSLKLDASNCFTTIIPPSSVSITCHLNRQRAGLCRVIFYARMFLYTHTAHMYMCTLPNTLMMIQ